MHMRHILEMFVTLRWAKPNDWHMCWRKLSQLTNHGAYQELVYFNEVLKTMLAGSTTPFLPSFLTVLYNGYLSLSTFSTILEPEKGWMENTKAFWILDRKIMMHSICFSCCAWPRKSVYQKGQCHNRFSLNETRFYDYTEVLICCFMNHVKINRSEMV